MKLITARPHRLLHEIIDRIGTDVQQGRRCMLLVPSQYTLQAEIEVMEQLKLEGTFLIDILSPGRLQSRVFDRAGQPERTIFDERGKCMILTQIIGEERENLTIYRSNAESSAQGLAQKMSSLIADFKRSGKTAEEIGTAARAAMEENAPSARKLMDAAVIYAAYERQTQGLLCDAEDVAAEFTARLGRSRVLENQHVYVYGFDMITPQFASQLMEIERHAASLTLAVETDGNSAPDGRMFAPVNFSLERLRQMAKEAGIAIEAQKLEGELESTADIRMLERGLYALSGKAQEEAPEHIELHAVSSMRQEVHKAAARIRSMLAEGKAASQIAVVYPAASEYAPLISGVFPQYGVSAYLSEKRAAGAHPLCRFVISALAVVSSGWRTADVTECVQTGFLKLSTEEKDDFCAYLEGVEIRGEAIRKPLRYIKDGDETQLERLNALRMKVCAPLEKFGRALSRAETADDTVTAVVELLADIDAFDTLERMRAELTEAGLVPEAEDCAQVWNELMSTLDQLHELLGGHSVPGKLVMQLLCSGLDALELAALPPADGAIVCGAIGNVRTARVDVLFALGMNDSGGAGSTGLFTPQEQEEAAQATGAYLGMSPAEHAALAQLDELKMLSGARNRLIVSYALADETGRALREGAAVQALKRLFPAMQVSGGLAAAERKDMLCAPDAALEALAVSLSDAADGKEEIDAAYAQAYAALAGSESGREKLLAVTRRLGEATPGRISAQQARELYGRPVMSVSRLETFAQCPYRHFVAYGLSPKENLKPGVDRAELGTLYHEAAERFTREITAQESFPQVNEAACDRIMDKIMTPLIAEWRKSPLGESSRGEAIARRIERTARRAGRNIAAQFADSRFKPMSFEMVFGKHGAAPIMLELPDGAFVYLQGRIDRIDVLDEGEKRVRVIDYKSGAKKFDPTMAYFGIQLQLLLYLAAALDQIPGAQPAGFFYCRIADPTIKSESRIKEEIERQIAKKLSLAGISLSNVEVLRAQGREHAAMITRDGAPSGTYKGSMADEAGMEAMVGFARRKAAQLAAQAYSGEIAAEPAAYGQYNACSFCDYAAVCGFDPATGRQRRLQKKTAEDLR